MHGALRKPQRATGNYGKNGVANVSTTAFRALLSEVRLNRLGFAGGLNS